MPSILILTATDRPENRSDGAVEFQLADAETVARRLITSVAGDVTLCFPTLVDAEIIDSVQHPTLATLPRTAPSVDLNRFDAIVVIPPQENSDGPLHPFAAESIGHFMEQEKFFALCSRTTIALRWLLPPDTVGFHKSEDVTTDETLCDALNSHLRRRSEQLARRKSGTISRLVSAIHRMFTSALRSRLSADDAVTIDLPPDLSDKVYVALKGAYSELLAANTNQHFYAFALFTDDSLQFLHPVANTEEALSATVERYRETVDPRYGDESTHNEMRWSYGDWGFFPDVGGDHFDEINAIVQRNFNSPEDGFAARLESLWAAILDGFRKLEVEHFFGSDAERSKITLLVVGDLPEERVESWVAALNPKEVVDRFLNWDTAPSDDASE